MRVRVCGLLEENEKILLIKHKSIGSAGYLWAPPGGGVEFGCSLEDTLYREFKEETNLIVKVKDFLFTNEFMDDRHHAIELFYRVTRKAGELNLGRDPELGKEHQILSEVRFVPFSEIKTMDKEVLHNIFSEVNTPENVFDLKGLFSFKY
ncbi:MAG: NUDIX hydrolase [Cyclobacteriaceae bacterium]